MYKAILRVEKIRHQGSAIGKTKHNYRLGEVPNTDIERQYLNREFVNTERKGIWEICEERIQSAGIKRAVRDDAVRGVEMLLTATPEYFKRDANGVCIEDESKSKWLKVNLEFMQKTYGKNLVAFTLHQDEKTPHIHAIVVPITSDARLSCKNMFNPKTLVKLQSDYAEEMKPQGLQRGIEGSTAKHTTMKKVYGLHKTIERLQSDVEEAKTLQKQLESLRVANLGLKQVNNQEAERLQLLQQHFESLEKKSAKVEKAGKYLFSRSLQIDKMRYLEKLKQESQAQKAVQKIEEVKPKVQDVPTPSHLRAYEAPTPNKSRGMRM